jgi:predicted nucleic acid-binding Zn ribbon protein
MATYTYKCKKCGAVIENVKQSMKDDAFETCDQLSEVVEGSCPEEDPGEIARVMSANVSVKFVGSGFYCNDYRGR